MDESKIENSMSLCTPPDLIEKNTLQQQNVTATAYSVTENQEDLDEQQNREVEISDLNTNENNNCKIHDLIKFLKQLEQKYRLGVINNEEAMKSVMKFIKEQPIVMVKARTENQS